MIPIFSTPFVISALGTAEFFAHLGDYPKTLESPVSKAFSPSCLPPFLGAFSGVSNSFSYFTALSYNLTGEVRWIHQNLSRDPAKQEKFNCEDATHHMHTEYLVRWSTEV